MGALMRRLESGAGGWPAQAGLRLGGALLLGGCALAVWALIVSIHRLPLHNADPAEFGEAVFSVIAWALGWALLIEGPGLFRLIPVPPRHVRFDNRRRDRRQQGKEDHERPDLAGSARRAVPAHARLRPPLRPGLRRIAVPLPLALAGLTALGLLIYLVAVLVRPERF